MMGKSVDTGPYVRDGKWRRRNLPGTFVEEYQHGADTCGVHATGRDLLHAVQHPYFLAFSLTDRDPDIWTPCSGINTTLTCISRVNSGRVN